MPTNDAWPGASNIANVQHNLLYLGKDTHTTRSLLGSDTDMVFCYQIALWVSGECEIVGRTHSLSVKHC